MIDYRVKKIIMKFFFLIMFFPSYVIAQNQECLSTVKEDSVEVFFCD